MPEPRLLVFSSLFPFPQDPNAGVFIRERMFRVGERLPIVVVSPKAWSPFDALIRRFRPRFRPVAPRIEVQRGVVVHAPRFFSLPGIFKPLDSTFMAVGSYFTLRRLKQEFGFTMIDAHFGYPDGHAASLLARWLKVPYTVTLRGSENVYSQHPSFRKRIASALHHAARVFSVSDSLRQLALSLDSEPDKTFTVSNAVDSEKFQPVDRIEARTRLGLAEDAQVLVSVGWLVEGKGFHRVIDCLPDLRGRHPHLQYLIVGGGSAAGSMEQELRSQVRHLALDDIVHFLGTQPHEELKWILSAADVFVLATRREGWANVLLEAMACGLPVISTDVGGNPEVVCKPELGQLVPFGDRQALLSAMDEGLRRHWDRTLIRAHAEYNSWDKRVHTLCNIFQELHPRTHD